MSSWGVVRGCRSAAFSEKLNPPRLPPGWDRGSAVRDGQTPGGRAEGPGARREAHGTRSRRAVRAEGQPVGPRKNEPAAASPAAALLSPEALSGTAYLGEERVGRPGHGDSGAVVTGEARALGCRRNGGREPR